MNKCTQIWTAFLKKNTFNASVSVLTLTGNDFIGETSINSPLLCYNTIKEKQPLFIITEIYQLSRRGKVLIFCY